MLPTYDNDKIYERIESLALLHDSYDSLFTRFNKFIPDEIVAIQNEYDHCRNALMVLLDGNEQAVKEAYAEALALKVENKGWVY